MLPVFFFRFNRLVFGTIIIVLALADCGEVRAQKTVADKSFVVIGSGILQGGNLQAARETAIKDSLVTAVELMTAEVLSKEALVANFSQINDIVFGDTDQYIQNYKVLTEATSGKYHRVVVEATVSGDKIARLLSAQGALRTQASLPTVVFLVAEQNVGEILPRFWWGNGMGNFQSIAENAVADIFRQKGITVVAHRGVRLQSLVDWAATGPDLTDQQAAELGARLKADAVVVGVSSAEESPNTMGYEMKSFKGTFDARVVRTETGEQILSVSQAAVATNANPYEGGQQALSSVGTAAGEVLAEQLTAKWQQIVEEPSQLELTVEGTSKLANFVKFRKALSSISGVEGIRVKEIKPNATILIVDYHGKGEALAAELMRNTFDTFGIDIYEITPNALKIALIPA